MLQDIGLYFWNVLWKMLFRHVSVLKISDIQLRNRKCYFWTKTKWIIVIYFWMIKETSILSFLMYYNMEYANFFLKTKKKKNFKIIFFPEGGLNLRPLALKSSPLDQNILLKILIKMMEQSNVCHIWKSQFLILPYLKISVFDFWMSWFFKMKNTFKLF